MTRRATLAPVSPAAGPSHDRTHEGRALLVGVALRVAVIAYTRPPAAWDGTIYTTLAGSLATGEGFVHWDGSGRATAFFPVGYPAALAAMRGLVGATASIYMVNLLAFVLTFASAVRLGTVLGGARGGRASGWAVALYPGLILWSAAAMTESLLGALWTAALAVCVTGANPPTAERRLARDSALRALVAGSLLGLASLVRPQTVLLGPVVGAISARGGGPRTRAGLAVLSLAAMLGVLAPWTARNARALGGVALVSTNGGSNLLIGTLPEARGGYRALNPTDPCGAVIGEIPRDACMSRAARARILEAPLRWCALGVRKVARTFAFEWAPVSYLRSTVPERMPRPVTLALAVLCSVGWWTLAALGSRGILSLWRNGHPDAALGLAAPVASVAVVHAVYIADDRYHLVLIGPLCAAAGALYNRSIAIEPPEDRASR